MRIKNYNVTVLGFNDSLTFALVNDELDVYIAFLRTLPLDVKINIDPFNRAIVVSLKLKNGAS